MALRLSSNARRRRRKRDWRRFGIKGPNRSLYFRRNDSNLRERAFSDQWEQEHQFQNLLQLLVGIETGPRVFGRPCRRFPWVIGPRERTIVATVIQWLGSNCGFSFLQEALRRAGYRIVPTDETSPCHDCSEPVLLSRLWSFGGDDLCHQCWWRRGAAERGARLTAAKN